MPVRLLSFVGHWPCQRGRRAAHATLPTTIHDLPEISFVLYDALSSLCVKFRMFLHFASGDCIHVRFHGLQHFINLFSREEQRSEI